MAAGLGLLKLSPQAFWAATPREISAAFPRPGREVLPREGLSELMQRFPDDV
jgi:uncharacterized phage protein (TIGR02216 family)